MYGFEPEHVPSHPMDLISGASKTAQGRPEMARSVIIEGIEQVLLASLIVAACRVAGVSLYRPTDLRGGSGSYRPHRPP
jgi:hypothetical protein